MTLTPQEIEKMQSVDIGAVSAEALPDLSGVRFDNSLPRRERMERLLAHTGNPYCFRYGEVGVKIEFAENGPPLQDVLASFLIRAKNGL